MNQKAQMQENQRKSDGCCLFAPMQMKEADGQEEKKPKSYYTAGIIPVQTDEVSVKHFFLNLPMLGKEGIMMTVSAKIGFLKEITLRLNTVEVVTRAKLYQKSVFFFKEILTRCLDVEG